MLIFSLILGIAIGYLIEPAQRAYFNYSWYRNFRKYTFKKSIARAFADIWS